MGIHDMVEHAKSVQIERSHHTSNKEETHQSDLAGQGVTGLAPVPAMYEASPNSGVSLEEYMFYAQIQREQEKLYRTAGISVEADAPHASAYHENAKRGSDEKVSQSSTFIHDKPQVNNTDASTFDQLEGLSEVGKESRNAHRAIKTASWVGIFYLITTDILGPYGAPYAMSQNGWVTGNVMYIAMGFCAWWCGIILWKLFLQLDSARYPVKTYGDLGERIVGHPMRWTFNALQTLQLIINVGLICLTNGQALSQVISGAPGNANLCFSVCVVLFSLIGMAFAQVQTFRGLGFAASTAVYQNIAIVIISMAAIIKYGPYIAGAQASYGKDYPYNNQPVLTEAFVSYPISQKINGIMNMVSSYIECGGTYEINFPCTPFSPAPRHLHHRHLKLILTISPPSILARFRSPFALFYSASTALSLRELAAGFRLRWSYDLPRVNVRDASSHGLLERYDLCSSFDLLGLPYLCQRRLCFPRTIRSRPILQRYCEILVPNRMQHARYSLRYYRRRTIRQRWFESHLRQHRSDFLQRSCAQLSEGTSDLGGSIGGVLGLGIRYCKFDSASADDFGFDRGYCDCQLFLFVPVYACAHLLHQARCYGGRHTLHASKRGKETGHLESVVQVAERLVRRVL